MNLGVPKVDYKRHQNQEATEVLIHDNQVVQGITNSYKPVIGHHS